MTPIAFDTETALFRPGCMLPPVTCASIATGDSDAWLVHQTHLYTVIGALLQAAVARHVVLIGHNMAFDMGVICAEYPDLMPLVFDAYEAGAIACTEVRQRMIDIADGCYEGFDFFDGKNNKISYSLDCTLRRHTDAGLSGKGTIQISYGELRNVPIAQWSEQHRTYPIDDAIATLRVWRAQEERADILEDQYRQTRAAFWLQLLSAWGLHTDQPYVHRYLNQKLEEYNALKAELVTCGLVGVSGKRNTKAAKARLESVWNVSELGDLPHTKGERVSLSKDTCRKSGDVQLIKYAEYSGTARSINTNGPILLAGVDKPIQSRFISIRETGRTSSRKPNVQNPDRSGGFRECFVPSAPQNVFIDADWSSFESCCLAQVCYTVLGYSRLREKLNAGLDPHLEIASLILHQPYDTLLLHKDETEVDMARQSGKVANFGYPGGLGPAGMVEYAYKLYKVELTLQESIELRQFWLTAWPEMADYFRWIQTMVGRSKHGGTIQHLFSNRYRGKTRYTQACNTFFQGLAADAAKETGWRICREMYIDQASPLFGFRLCNFIHDEFLGEGPADRAPEAAERMSQIMVETAQKWLPDMVIRAEPCIMDRWYKKAKTLRDENGRLMVYSEAGK